MNKQEALEAMLAAARMHEQPDGMASQPQRRQAHSRLMRTVREGLRDLEAAENDEDLVNARALHAAGTDLLVKAGGMILAMLTEEEG